MPVTLEIRAAIRDDGQVLIGCTSSGGPSPEQLIELLASCRHVVKLAAEQLDASLGTGSACWEEVQRMEGEREVGELHCMIDQGGPR